VTLAACGSNPQDQENDQQVSLNPYLLNRQKVSSEAMDRFNAATAAIENQQWQQAEQDLHWLVTNHPELSGPYLDLALIYKQTDQPEKADEFFSMAIVVNSTNLDAYNQYAIFLREQGNFQQAEATYLAALSIWADYPDTHKNIGVLYDLYMGKKEAALQHYLIYQGLTDGSDKQVAAWIVDLERQLNTVARGDQ
jgi:Tfp pilus assembly protein PilF